MDIESSYSKPGNSIFLTTLGAVAFLVLLGVLGFIRSHLVAIEERLEINLAYQPPEAVPVAAGDYEPVFTIEHALTLLSWRYVAKFVLLYRLR